MIVVGVGFSIIFSICDNGRVEDICAAAVVMFLLLLLLLDYNETNWTIKCSTEVLVPSCSFQPVSFLLPVKTEL
jgi:Ca2+/Na+ antiporter